MGGCEEEEREGGGWRDVAASSLCTRACTSAGTSLCLHLSVSNNKLQKYRQYDVCVWCVCTCGVCMRECVRANFNLNIIY